jgi:hypothetical protein
MVFIFIFGNSVVVFFYFKVVLALAAKVFASCMSLFFPLSCMFPFAFLLPLYLLFCQD